MAPKRVHSPYSAHKKSSSKRQNSSSGVKISSSSIQESLSASKRHKSASQKPSSIAKPKQEMKKSVSFRTPPTEYRSPWDSPEPPPPQSRMAEPRQPPRDHHRRMRPNTRPKFVDSSVPLNQATREDLVAALEVLDRREAITYEEKLLQAEWEDTSDEEEEEETDAVDNTQQEHVTWDPLIRPHQLFGDQVNVHSVDDITADEFRMIVKFLGEYGREYLHPQMPNEELYEVYDNDDCFSVAIRRFFNATGKWATANTIKDILKSKDYSIVVSDGNDHDQTYRMSNAEYEEKEVRIKAAMIEKLEAERKVMEESIKAREQSKMTAKDKGKAKEPATEKTKQDPPTKKGTQAKTQSRALRSLSLGDAARLLVGGPSSRKKVQAKKGIN